LDHIRETDKADQIRNAIAKVIEKGETRTYDMLRFTGGADVLEKGACSTSEMTNAIIDYL
jgi:3-isopropylmalate dehydrogenase